MVQLLLLLFLLLLLAHSFQIYCIKPIIVQYKLKHHLLHQILAQKYITLSPQRKKKHTNEEKEEVKSLATLPCICKWMEIFPRLRGSHQTPGRTEG